MSLTCTRLAHEPTVTKVGRGSVASANLSFRLSAEDFASIERAVGSGVSLDEVARNALESRLYRYLILAEAKEAAAPVNAVRDRLRRIEIATQTLQDLLAHPDEDHDDAEAQVRLDICIALESVAVPARAALAGLQLEAECVRQELDVDHDTQVDPEVALASELERIWGYIADRPATFSAVSPFVQFVLASTDLLPSHWPWRTKNRRKEQSKQAFAEALRRAIHR